MLMENTILITCFETFGGENFNASMAVVKAMPKKIGELYTEKIILPVEFGRSAELAAERARASSAELIVCFGEARARKCVMPELVAINLNHAAIPDNVGKEPKDEPIVPGGTAAYFTAFPVRRLAESISNEGVQAALSYSAGAYVCNDLYYRLLREFEGTCVRVVFIHLPRADGEEAYKNMAFAISRALCSIISEENNG
jgi:pyroglutamyl-peptidase